jgi:trimethylamine--corrinoid protein Co-methyltransferase
MARYYGIPSMMGGMGTSAKWPGAQVGFEKAITSMGPAMAGCDLLTGLGGLNDAAFVNMEQMLIDAQVWEDIKRLYQGMDVSGSELSLDVIKKVGPKGQFLNNPHTFANFRKLHISKYSDRASYMAWEKGGKKDIWDRVHEEVKKILSTHRPAPLPDDVDAKLANVEQKAATALA